MQTNPQEVYDQLLEELAAGEMNDLQRQIFNLLREHPDGLNRYDLVEHIYDYRPVTLDGNIHDRKIRKAIEKLRQRLYPIVSTSGKPGYRLDVTKESAEKMLAELNSRIDHMQEQARAVQKFFKLESIPRTYRPPRRIRTKSVNGVQQLEMPL